MRTVIHLLASAFLGGPERQMLGLAGQMAGDVRTVFLTFGEKGRCRPFLREAAQRGIEALELQADTPWFGAAVREIAGYLEELQADVLLCHGYKADLLGRRAARRQGVPVVAVSRGWTGESLKVRLYEAIDRFGLRWMDRVVCVSEAQAEKVRRAGVRPERVRVIRNAIDPERFLDPDPRYRAKLARSFRTPRRQIVGAAGRLSPEKGFDVLVAGAAEVVQRDPSVGFVLFGEGACRPALARQIQEAGLAGNFVLAGFRGDLDRFVPFFDLLVLPSYTEGLPNVVLEACAAGVPVLATAVGGTPEVLQEGVNGFLVPPGKPQVLADRLLAALASEERLRQMGLQGRQRVLEGFTFAAQAAQYAALFDELCPAGAAGGTEAPAEVPPPKEEAPAEPAPTLATTEMPCER
jgi:glycosyltransferase involved in cell wall biosynthesis